MFEIKFNFSLGVEMAKKHEIHMPGLGAFKYSESTQLIDGTLQGLFFIQDIGSEFHVYFMVELDLTVARIVDI